MRNQYGWVATSCVALIVGASWGATPARAQPAADATLDSLAKEAYARGDYPKAVAAFEAAYARAPLAKYLYNLGRCHEKLGDFAPAAGYLEGYLRAVPDAEDRAEVEGLIEVIRHRLVRTHGRIKVTSAPSGALLFIEAGERRVKAATPYWGWVPFGEAKLVLRMEGYDAVKRTVVVGPGTPVAVELTLGASESGEAQAAPVSPVPVPSGRRAVAATPVESSLLPWVGLSVGAAMIGSGFGLLAMSRSDRDERDDLIDDSSTRPVTYRQVREIDGSARVKWWGGNAMLTAGVLAAAASVGLLFWHGEDTAAPRVGASPAGVSLTWGAIR